MTAPTPLQMASIDELCDELASRCDAGFIVLQVPVHTGKAPRGGLLHRRTIGNMLHCRGILDTHRDLFYKDLSDNLYQGDPDAHYGT